MNTTPSAERLHIGFFGLRNAGKSSVVNAVTGQLLAVVSDIKGTTTDPVQKAMELLPLGPVVIVDTPGIDDEGTLGELRVQKTKEVLGKTDIALLVTDIRLALTEEETALIRLFEEREIPYLIVYNKTDLAKEIPAETDKEIAVSAVTGANIDRLKDKIAALVKTAAADKRLVGDLLTAGDTVVLVTPIDESAPKGRLILPQQQTIRDILDADAMAVVSKETTLAKTLASLAVPPRMVITDSQAFGEVAKIVPPDVPLTSFSILFVRYKGDLVAAAKGAAMLDRLRDGDKVLISEGCTHHRQCGDIGTVKLPRLVKKHTGKEIAFDFTSGGTFPDDLSEYALVIHCGACMLNEREMRSRTARTNAACVPMTNYGIALAYMNGILRRSLALFPDALAALDA